MFRENSLRIPSDSPIFVIDSAGTWFLPSGSTFYRGLKRRRNLEFALARRNQAGINSKSFRTHPSLSKAILNDYHEHEPQDVALLESAWQFFERLRWSGTFPSNLRRQNEQ